jgi:hypothetical protein
VGNTTHRARLIGGVILIATGAVWIGQGTGLLQGQSFMTGDPLWTIFGIAAVVAGVAFIAWVMRQLD